MTCIGPHLWSLDIRDNFVDWEGLAWVSHLTSQNLPNLLAGVAVFLSESPEYQLDQVDDNGDTAVPFRRDDFKHISAQLTTDTWSTRSEQLVTTLYNSLPPSDQEEFPILKNTGITHLYFSNNRVNADEVLHIMNILRGCQVLDVGSVRCSGVYLDRSYFFLPGAACKCSFLDTVFCTINGSFFPSTYRREDFQHPMRFQY